MKKTTKQILSFVLSCILICSGLQSVTAEKTSNLDKAKNLLAALNIASDDSNSIVTREQFADIYVRANNIYQEGYVTLNPFDDTYDAEYADAIHIMRDLGIVSGVGNNCYAPSDNMMTKDIAKLYVSALGLDVYAESTGKGYMQVAYDVDMFKGVVVSDYITMDSLILLTYNFLLAPVGVQNFTDPPSYSINDDTNILYEKFDVYQITGQVIQNDMSGIWSSVSAPEGHVVIKTKDGEITALSGKSGVASMLGHTLDIYIYDVQGEYEVVCYEKRANELSVIIDIGRIDFDNTDNSRISYIKEGRTSVSSEDLSDFPSFIINGAYYDIGQFDISVLENYSGTISLVSSGKTDYDIVIIEAYTNYFVKNVEHYNGVMRIFDSGDNDMLVLDETAYKKMEMYYPNGAAASPFEIRAGMLLTVAKSFGTENYIKILISDTVLEGNISWYDQDEMLLSLDNGENYRVSPSYKLANVSIRTPAKLYLDVFGAVAWIDYDKTATYSYGYLKLARMDNEEGKIQLKAVVETGKFAKMYLAEKTIIDGKSYKSAEEQLMELENIPIGLKREEKFKYIAEGEYPFRYRLNEAGEIKEIDSPRRSEYEDADSFRPVDCGEGVLCSSDKILAKRTPLSGSTVVFAIPEKENTGERNDPEFYKVGNSSLMDTSNGNTFVAFRIGDDSLYVDLVIKPQTTIKDSVGRDSQLFLVKDVKAVYDEKDEEIRTKIVGLEGGTEKEYLVHEQFDKARLEKVKRGDVLRFSLTSGEITAMEYVFIYNDANGISEGSTGKYYKPSSSGTPGDVGNGIYASYYYSGYVTRREGTLIEILPFDIGASESVGLDVPNRPNWADKSRDIFNASSKISIYDPSLGAKDAVYVGDLEDIPAYEDGGGYAKVIVRYRSRSVQEMVVLKDQSLFQ